MADPTPSCCHAQPAHNGAPHPSAAKYICPMCPGVVADKPGPCPMCGMALERNPAWQGDSSSCHDDEEDETKDLLKRFGVGALLCVPLLVLSMGEDLAFVQQIGPHWSGILQLLLSTPVVFWSGKPLLLRGLRSLWPLRLNMFSLILLGVMAAWGYSIAVVLMPESIPHVFKHGGGAGVYFESAAVITVLVLLGQVLESRARKATTAALEALIHLVPKKVWRVNHGVDEELDLDRVLVGDLLRVKPSSRVPVDGEVVDGSSFVDESMLTGEPMPVSKSKGLTVTAGTMNTDGSFIMRADRVGSETLLSQIVDMVSRAQRSRAPVQRLADHVAAWFVPLVIMVALWTFMLWWKLGPQPGLAYGIINAVAVLIIACPCALGLATPMALTVGIGRGAQLGVLIKDAEALERLESVNTLMLDKTGTLTQGRPTLSLMHPLPGQNAKDLLLLAAALETSSEHPLARAIVQAAKDRQLRVPAVEQFISVPGAGVAGLVQGREVAVGQASLMEKASVPVPADLMEKVERLQGQGHTVVFIAVDGKLCGLFAIADKLKETTAEAVKGLHALGLHLVMTTGDNAVTARRVAEELGMDEVHASLKPEEKLYQVYQAREAGRLVAVAGDGINDAPALAAAHVGIAMGNGTDVAIQSADITLMRGDLRGIQQAIGLSRATMKTIRQNLWFAFLYNGLGIPLAAGVLYPLFGWLMNPMIASAAMSLSSISVILNSLRLKRFKVP